MMVRCSMYVGTFREIPAQTDAVELLRVHIIFDVVAIIAEPSLPNRFMG
jgi:hypothetical protein